MVLKQLALCLILHIIVFGPVAAWRPDVIFREAEENLNDILRGPTNKKQTLVVTTILEPPFLELKPNIKQTIPAGNDKYQGYIVDLMEMLGKKLNVSYRLNLVADGKYGEIHNGKWNGMIREIVEKRADIAAAPMTISHIRMKSVRFTKAFMTTGMTTLIKKTICHTNQTTCKLETLREMKNKPSFTYGTVAGSSDWQFFKQSKNPVYAQMRQKMQKWGSNVGTVADGIAKVRDSSSFGFITDTSFADYYARKKPCDLIRLDVISMSGYGMGFPKDASYDNLFNRANLAILLLRENGELYRLYRKYWRDTDKC